MTTSRSRGGGALKVTKQGLGGEENLLCTERPGRETWKQGSRELLECVQDTEREI